MLHDFMRLEANIKRELSRVYKEIHGKGPDETTVKIWENVVIIKLTASLTNIEETLRNSVKGDELIHKIFDILIFEQQQQYIPLIEEILGTKVTAVNYSLGKEDNTLYLYATLEECVAYSS